MRAASTGIHNDLYKFNCYYLNPLSEKILKEQKTIFLLGDFNVDLLKYEQHKATNEFLDSLSSYMFLPYNIQPTRITFHSKSIINNICSNYIFQEIISGKLTSTISDHLPQFFIAPHIFPNTPNKIPTFLNGIGQNSVVKSSLFIILQ